ncbi:MULTISPECIES: winged helix-turn-helix transcriptional regulator [Pseudomonas]|uniref:winged helix-turn-helix transcriptional regulator n=1 Tax=Pseudomonas TaxID=286 RepID=UPI001DD99C83|nr:MULTISPECIES: helix-turn-helix domain-containing protein [Pseudomonas]MCX2707789.1 helix-turn-helix domain-containing protein [Pseudomonas sp. DCB_BG]MBP2271647.1 DNA-binding HxlR family transcriptional regulator [Pseudomonas sp. BP6]MBP2289382.1 DNA-binding HxlR family transcriptional regulator [Pseudomonas sp. BP7]MDD2141418.1 helix-turn-helix transcriptional regulator [Pseudomonas putida]MDD2145764.1 helix-turn-helix transcriptional regulator [Pseudomonas putida]
MVRLFIIGFFRVDGSSSRCYYQFDTDNTPLLKAGHYQNSMDVKNSCDDPCPIARSLAVAGDAWSILILRDAHAGIARFDQFRKSLGIAPTMLTRRLAALTEEGLLEKRRYSEHPPREEYLLTAAGRDFLPVLFMIGAWGRQYRGGGKLTRFFDAQTGTEIKAVAVDEITGAKIGTRPMRIVTPDES